MKEVLNKLGLSDNEAEIYLKGLAVGRFAAGQMAKLTRIKRSTAYLALENLLKLGLISESYSGKKRMFVSESPEALELLTHRMQRSVTEAKQLANNLIPVLNNIVKSIPNEPKIEFYKGANGVKNILMTVSGSPESWYLFGSVTKILKILPPKDIKEILEEGEKARQKSGRPKIYFIADEGLIKIPGFSIPDPSRREIKILPGIIQTASSFILSEDKLILINFTMPFAAVIKNKDMYSLIKVMYDLVWNSLGPKIY